MSDNYSDEVRPLLKLLRTPAFRFIIICYNHADPVRKLENEIKARFPDRPFIKIDAEKEDYQDISQSYFSQGAGFFWIQNFHDVLREERDSLGEETPEMALNNKRRRNIAAGLNLRRDKLAKYPIALFVLVPTTAGELYARTIMEKMPDLWSFRSMIVDLQVDLAKITVGADFHFFAENDNIDYTTLGGGSIEEKKAELERLTIALAKVPENEVSYRNTLIEQINELGHYVEYVTTGVHLIAGRNNIVGIRNVGGSKIPRALTPPPFLPEIFLGREDDLKHIHRELYNPDGHLLLLTGEGGIGKSSLASKYYYLYRDEYAHVAWVLSEKSISNALLLLAMPLGLGFEPQLDSDARLEILLNALANLPKPSLLIIDNANELEDLERNYARLLSCSNFHLLLTTRIRDFAKARTYTIAGLPEPEALALFEKHYHTLSEEERTLFFQIQESVDGNTLVLELLAKNLAAQNRLRPRYSLADLLADLQSRGLLKLNQGQEVHTNYEDKGPLRREIPESVLAAIYDLSELTAEEISLLSVFAVLPAEMIPFDLLKNLLTGLEDRLPILVQKGWIEFKEVENTFKCSPVVQGIVRQKNKKLRKDCDTLIDKLNEKLEYVGYIGHLLNSTYEEAVLFARYAETVLAVIDIPDDNLYLLADRLGRYYNTTGDLNKALLVIEKSSQIAQALCLVEPNNSEFKNMLALSYEKLGDTHSTLGNLDKSLTFFEQSNQLEKELYESYPQNMDFKNGLAISYQYLGNTHSLLGNLDKALTFFEQYNQLREELYELYPQNVDFKNGLAVSYSKLGDTHSSFGNLDKALTFFEYETKLSEELHESYPQNVDFKNGLAVSYSKLGDTHSSLGNLDKALTFHEKDLSLTKELYESYPQNVSLKNSLAISYGKLGETHRLLGNMDKALIFYEDETILFEELHNSYPQNVSFKNGLAFSYAKLGEFHKSNLINTKAYFKQAEKLWVELVRDAPQYVQFQKYLGMVRKELEENSAPA